MFAIRRAALFACITGLLALVGPVWNSVQTIRNIDPARRVWWAAPLAVIGALVGSLLLAFYLALYRNKGSLRFTRGLRLLALSTAVVYGIRLAIALPGWVGSFHRNWAAMRVSWMIGASSLWIAARDPGTRTVVSLILAQLSNIAVVLLLVAFFSHRTEEGNTVISARLQVMTKVTVIVWGIVVGLMFIATALSPFAYIRIGNEIQRAGATPPPVWRGVANQLRTVLDQACLFVAPYILYKSQSMSG